MEEALESEVAPDSEMTMDSEMVLDSVKVASDSVEVAPDSVESLCARCGTFHANDDDGEACFQAHRRAHRCALCGLLHEDYDLTAWILHDMEKFDCEMYIPDVEKLEMNGETIILPEHVQKKLDEHIEKMKQGAMEDAKKD
uniref:Uncharacterized protein n=1 Tax=Setaria viridis TaxID=4556 RepID=A0A4U6U285_SETVI|nr:hypothetical protein SEVIR_6G057000v2 [Setaria viridis]